MAMSIDALFKAAENTVVTDEMRDALVKRLKEADRRFAEEDERKYNFPPGFMDRQYTI